jgi:hypothetical protein
LKLKALKNRTGVIMSEDIDTKPGMDPEHREQLKEIVVEAFSDRRVQEAFAGVVAAQWNSNPAMHDFLDVLSTSVKEAGRGAGIEVSDEGVAAKGERAAAKDSASSGELPVSTAVTADRPDANQQVTSQPKPRVVDSVQERQEVLQEPDTAKLAKQSDREARDTSERSAGDGASSKTDAVSGGKEKPQYAHDRREVGRKNDLNQVDKVTKQAGVTKQRTEQKTKETTARNDREVQTKTVQAKKQIERPAYRERGHSLER